MKRLQRVPGRWPAARRQISLAGLVAMLLAGLSTSPVPAQERDSAPDSFDRRWYVGAGIVASRLDPDTRDVPESVDERDATGGSLTIGYDLLPRLSIEGSYADLGQATLSPDGNLNYQVGSLDLLLYGLNAPTARYQRTGASLFGRLGLGVMDVDSALPVETVRPYSLLAGLGVEYGFDSGIGLRAEFVSQDSDARYARIGVIYRIDPAAVSAAARAARRAGAAAVPGDASRADPRSPVDRDADGVPDRRDDCPLSSPDLPVDETGCDAFDRASSLVDFRSGSAILTAAAYPRLDDVIDVMNRFPEATVTIDAHTDNVGGALANLQLSAQRAIAVARYLIDRGIDADRLQPRAFGESRPRAGNATREGRAANRRVEFRVQ